MRPVGLLPNCYGGEAFRSTRLSGQDSPSYMYGQTGVVFPQHADRDNAGVNR